MSSSAADFERAANAVSEFACLVRAQVADDAADDRDEAAGAVAMWNIVYGPHLATAEEVAVRWSRDLEAATGLAVELAKMVADVEGASILGAVELAERRVVGMYRDAADAVRRDETPD